MYSYIYCLLLFILTCDGLINHHDKIKRELDAGEPLFLTTLIENGDITRAQSLSRVKHPEFLNVQSYAGYITVNKTFNSNMFFWYFPAESNWENAPVVMWLNGGPGTPSLFGLFTGSGPFYVSDNKVRKRKYAWSRNHNVIYIDNPVGTGFSFTENEAGYARNKFDVGRDLYNCLIQFFQLFPSLQKNDFYVAGESYAGKHVPAISYTIHQNNANAKVKINLKGMVIGVGFCDPIHQLNYGDYWYQLGLIDNKALKMFHDYEEKIAQEIENHKYASALELFDEMMEVIKRVTGFNHYFHYLYAQDPYIKGEEDVTKFVQRDDVRKAIHVGTKNFHSDKTKVKEHMKDDLMDTVAPWISELLSHYRCLFYNGQLDMRLPYTATVNFLQNLNFSASREYINAERRIWKVNGEIAGYSKAAGNLTEVLVRNAGHFVPHDQPHWAWDLITRFTSGSLFC